MSDDRGAAPRGRGVLGLALAVVAATATGRAAEAPPQAGSSPRWTPAVDVIRRVEAGVVAIFSEDANGRIGSVGSGSVIGGRYVLTNHHVVPGRRGLVLVRGSPPKEFRVVGRLPDKDLALLRVEGQEPLTAIPLGRSHDLAAGESVLAGGNPGGRGVVFSGGMVSSPGVMVGVNALAMAVLPKDARYRFIQFDAAVNRGNSGGPLVNAEGLQVGVVSMKVPGEDNVGYAVPIDRVRTSFRALAAPEERGDFWTGATMDPLADGAVVAEAAAGSPAARAGLRRGDRVSTLEGKPLLDGGGWLLALLGRKAGDVLTMTVDGAWGRREARLSLGPFPLARPVPAEGKSPGVRYEVFHKSVTALDDLRGVKPVRQGTAAGVDLSKVEGLRAENFVVVFTGYVEVPETGVYQLVIASDDGSRLFLDGQLAVDNDGPHAVQEARGLRRLAKGLHPFRLEFFQATGQATLGFWMERDGQPPGGPQAPIRLLRD